jgi:LysR family transcriptional regulator, regulator for bpeEF and oprC
MMSPHTSQLFDQELLRGKEKVTLRERHALALVDANGTLVVALAGLGVVLTYEHLAAPYVSSGALETVLRDSVPLRAAYPTRRYLPRKVPILIDWLVELSRTLDFDEARTEACAARLCRVS